MSPIEAMNAAAVWMLTPGTAIRRRISREPSACSGQRRLQCLQLGVEEVELAQAPVERQSLVDAQLQ